MKQNSINISIVPDKRRTKDKDTYPLKLRLTYKGLRKYYSTGYDANLKDWRLIQTDKAKGRLRSKALALLEIRLNAEKCCNNIVSFSFTKFEKAFFPKALIITDVKSAFKKYIAALYENGQISTAMGYEGACKSFHKFKSNLKFEHLTVDFLKSYERWFVGQQNLLQRLASI